MRSWLMEKSWPYWCQDGAPAPSSLARCAAHLVSGTQYSQLQKWLNYSVYSRVVMRRIWYYGCKVSSMYNSSKCLLRVYSCDFFSLPQAMVPHDWRASMKAHHVQEGGFRGRGPCTGMHLVPCSPASLPTLQFWLTKHHLGQCSQRWKLTTTKISSFRPTSEESKSPKK